MPMVMKRFCVFVVITAILVGAAGCQPAQQQTLPTLTSVVVDAPAQAASPSPGAAAYPEPAQGSEPTAPGYPVEPPAAEPTAYPVEGQGGPAAGVPAIENQSKVTARLIESAPDSDNASYTRLHSLILTSEDVASMQNFTRDRVNTEVDLYAETAQLPELKAGDTFEAIVSYQGDERGGKYFAKEIKKLE